MPRSKKPQIVTWNVWADDPDVEFVIVAQIDVPTRFITDRPANEQIAALRDTYGFIICRPATAGFPADQIV